VRASRATGAGARRLLVRPAPASRLSASSLWVVDTHDVQFERTPGCGARLRARARRRAPRTGSVRSNRGVTNRTETRFTNTCLPVRRDRGDRHGVDFAHWPGRPSSRRCPGTAGGFLRKPGERVETGRGAKLSAGPPARLAEAGAGRGGAARRRGSREELRAEAEAAVPPSPVSSTITPWLASRESWPSPFAPAAVNGPVVEALALELPVVGYAEALEGSISLTEKGS